LYDYYNRCKETLAPEGFEDKRIDFIIRIDEEGRFLGLEDFRKGKTFRVVKTIGRTSAPAAQTLWDNEEYVLNYLNKGDEKSRTKHVLFQQKIEELCTEYPENRAFQAVRRFYEQEQKESIKNNVHWAEVEKKPAVNLSFRLNGEPNLIAEHSDLWDYTKLASVLTSTLKNDFPICLVTAERAEPALTSTATMIPGSQATAKLVAFQVNSGYDSYGKSQGMNAPISKSAEFAYTTALNTMLSKDSHNKKLINDRTFLFWASSADDTANEMEEGLFDFFGWAKNEDKDNDPNRRLTEVRQLFNDVYSGVRPTSNKDRFYFLGLAPNAARIAVVYWNECSLKEFAGQILRHFDDMEIVDTRPDKKPYSGMMQILAAVSLDNKISNLDNPSLPEAVLKSIIQGLPYPDTLFQACIRRIRANQSVTITQAAILKGYINRKINNYNNLKLIEMALDKTNTDIGYLCGRLFAVLEQVQAASGGATTIRERYMNGASATPAAVLSTLLNLSVHHAEKLDKGRQIFFEREKGEIIDKIPADGFPAHLDLQQQARFFVGYYHQRQYFFSSKKDVANETENQ
jgi:CRISPR-associated protein Csd1